MLFIEFHMKHTFLFLWLGKQGRTQVRIHVLPFKNSIIILWNQLAVAALLHLGVVV